MAKLEFNKPTKKKKTEDSEADIDLYDMMLSQQSDFVEEDDDDEEENEFANYEEIDAKELGPKLSKALREELQKPEYNRDFLKFKYNNEIFEGIPEAEINPGKFVFSINGKLKAINLSNIFVL